MKRFLSVASVVVIALPAANSQALEQTIKNEQAKPRIATDGVIGLGGNIDMVRMAVSDDIAAGSLDSAVDKARQLVTAEPNNAKNHLLLARAITAKFKRDEPHNRLLYEECLDEWSYVNHNLDDVWERDEAKNQLMELHVDKVVAKLKGTPKSKSVFGRLLPGMGK